MTTADDMAYLVGLIYRLMDASHHLNTNGMQELRAEWERWRHPHTVEATKATAAGRHIIDPMRKKDTLMDLLKMLQSLRFQLTSDDGESVVLAACEPVGERPGQYVDEVGHRFDLCPVVGLDIIHALDEHIVRLEAEQPSTQPAIA